MDGWLKQSTAVTLKIGPFVDSTDGNTEETALTIAQVDVRLSKNGGDFAQKNETTSCVHDELGLYDCAVNTTDTNTLGRLELTVHEAGALIVRHTYMVLPANVWDSLFGGDKLQVDAVEWAGAATATDDLALKATLAKGTDITGFNDLSAAQVNAEVDAALDTAIPVSPTADSLNERVKALDDNYTASRAANLDNADATVSSRATPAQVNTEVLDVLNTDTFAEPGQEAPPATTTLIRKIGWLYKVFRNRVTVTNSTISIYADNGTTVDAKSPHTDDGTTYDRPEFVSGP